MTNKLNIQDLNKVSRGANKYKNTIQNQIQKGENNMSEKKKKMNDEELKKTTGGYDDPHLYLPAGTHVKYRIWYDNKHYTEWTGTINTVSYSGDYLWKYNIKPDLSSSYICVKASDVQPD